MKIQFTYHTIHLFKVYYSGASLVGQWLRLYAPNAGGLGSIPGWGTRSRMLELRVCILQVKIPRATVKIKEPMCCN